MEYFVPIAPLLFLFVAVIWSPERWLNLFIKMTFFIMVIWGSMYTYELFLK